ncbi:hypothetical protein A3D70_00395 [Candidatus Adlerbacteria bacterium RIFCSPHIGHO2_02_FULL_54_18]|uniref:Uncharacterized protein n=2 Tax=Candidatus Adleribacteriota TaxID=1752736 RepID=A0A1F4Y273_9BACT|nr:MAG: hypothetical protein A2949_00305 [Candidatus Adlerbacteria bacterium RIFCSPLOWO2_01_FULL_54_21b]OGC88070.1 MAG: hypothetical protein A3D70_00395 [Candidatus Adlerbacteria bacterium RIFCSPHIGHO2_02_FULL_54_18]
MNILKNKQVIGAAAVVLLCGLVYYFWGTGGVSPLLTSTAEPTSPLSEEILATLSNLNTIRLDPSIFKDPVFISLTDFGVTIPAEQTGRRNPFAPVGQ